MSFRNINIRYILNEAVKIGGIIVDVREFDEFNKGHIPMAINIPLKNIEEGKISLPKGKTIIVYCENGGGSTMAARLLDEKGYKVVNAIGGIKKYNGALTKKGMLRG